MRNPKWKREELILALELYFGLEQGQMHKNNSEVISLSKNPRQMKLFTNIPDIIKFRNPSSLSRKLGNFKSVDETYKLNGLKHISKLDVEVWEEFKSRRNTLKDEADRIRKLHL